MNENDKDLNINILKHLEDISSQINKAMEPRARNIFRRYPISFGILILIGVTALHEGLKGILKTFGMLDSNPWYLLLGGLVLLLITGTIYKKLEK
jgi:hypothetical protein